MACCQNSGFPLIFISELCHKKSVLIFLALLYMFHATSTSYQNLVSSLKNIRSVSSWSMLLHHIHSPMFFLDFDTQFSRSLVQSGGFTSCAPPAFFGACKISNVIFGLRPFHRNTWTRCSNCFTKEALTFGSTNILCTNRDAVKVLMTKILPNRLNTLLFQIFSTDCTFAIIGL